MKKVLLRSPLFLFLLPIFFVLHGFVENFFFIRFSDCLILMAMYTGAALILYLLSWLILRTPVKAALAASFIMGFYLFFGALHDFLRLHSIFLHRYSIILPSFVIAAVLLIFYLKRERSFGRTNLFLNVLLLAWLLVDAGTLVWKAATGSHAPYSAYSRSSDLRPCDTCANPDIYFLIFDGYSGSETLKDIYHYDNGPLDSFLIDEGFHIQKRSRSNYYRTPFSIASMLNFSYLDGIPDPQHLVADDYTNLFETIGKDRVVNFLISRGYTIINHSPFDLPGSPASLDQPFIPVKTRLITNRTLFHYIARDMGAWFNDRFGDSAVLSGDYLSNTYEMNRRSLEETVETSRERSAHPRFIYTHLFMPHYPFLFDSLLRRRRPQEVLGELVESDLTPYLGYLPYTNTCVKRLLSAIRQNSGGRAVILFMSDHGFRHSGDGSPQPYFFNNQNAVYFPDGDYHLLYDSISGVNQFRVILNKLFSQKLPLLKDSLIYLRDKE
jgi:hypothetical protein